MKKINSTKNILKRKFFRNAFRVPTEFQINTWENEGGCVNGVCDKDIVIINGVLCQTWLDRVKATFSPHWRNIKLMFGGSRHQVQQQS